MGCCGFNNTTSTKPHSTTVRKLRAQVADLFHGTSSHTSGPFMSSSACGAKSPTSSHQTSSQNHIDGYPPYPRSPTATHSVIDPSFSPFRRPATINSYLRLITSPRFSLRSDAPFSTTLADMDIEGGCQGQTSGDRRRRQRRKRRQGRGERLRPVATTKPSSVKRKVYNCVISGLSLIIALTIYLVLAVSNKVSHQAFHVFMILIIIFFTILFCHSILRLSMVMLRRPTDEERAVRILRRAGSGGYAQPERPIRVVLARDEEIGISGTGDPPAGHPGPAPPPPAYGLWRCSVKADPDLLHWQHAVHPAYRQGAFAEGGMAERPGTANRPPSYLAQEPLSPGPFQETASSGDSYEDVVLPVHPSERNRVYLI